MEWLSRSNNTDYVFQCRIGKSVVIVLLVLCDFLSRFVVTAELSTRPPRPRHAHGQKINAIEHAHIVCSEGGRALDP